MCEIDKKTQKILCMGRKRERAAPNALQIINWYHDFNPLMGKAVLRKLN